MGRGESPSRQETDDVDAVMERTVHAAVAWQRQIDNYGFDPVLYWRQVLLKSSTRRVKHPSPADTRSGVLGQSSSSKCIIATHAAGWLRQHRHEIGKDLIGIKGARIILAD